MAGNRQNLDTLRGMIAGEPGTAPTMVLKRLRESRGLSQAQVAAAAGISGEMLSKVEGGSRELTPAVAMKAARSLGVNPDDLQTAHMLDTLKRKAEAGEVAPEEIRDMANNLAIKMEQAGYGESEELWLNTAALMDVHQAATKAYKPQEAGMRETDGFGRKVRGSDGVRAATKEAARSSAYGLRDKQEVPLDPTGEQHRSFRDGLGRSRDQEPIERDAQGRRINKPYGPNRGR